MAGYRKSKMMRDGVSRVVVHQCYEQIDDAVTSLAITAFPCRAKQGPPSWRRGEFLQPGRPRIEVVSGRSRVSSETHLASLFHHPFRPSLLLVLLLAAVAAATTRCFCSTLAFICAATYRAIDFTSRTIRDILREKIPGSY